MKRVLICLAAMLMLLPCAWGEEYEYREETVTTVTVTADRVNVRSGPGTRYAVVGTALKGETYNVTRPYGEWYQIETADGGEGCIHKDFVDVSEETRQVKVKIEEPLETYVKNEKLPTLLKKGGSFSVGGTVVSNVAMSAVTVTVTNDNRLTRELQASVTFSESDNVKEYDLSALNAKLLFGSLVSGEKTLTVQVKTFAQEETACRHQFTVLGTMQDPVSLNDRCRIVATYGKASVLTDTYTGTIWRPSSSSSKITIDVPADAEPGSFTIAWEKVPSGFSVVCKDGAGNEVDRFDRGNTEEMLVNYWLIDNATRTIEIVLEDTNSGICELRVFQEGRVSRVQQIWQLPPEKLDMMLISTHQDDEWLFFAGSIPYAVDKGKDVAVLYMANCNRMRYGEAMAGLWHGGLTNYPIFLGLEDYFAGSYDAALKRWGEETTLTLLVEQIRKYKPDVVLTHDFNGEYENNQHRVTAKCVARAVELAQDPTFDPESAEEWGVWEVKKLYIHLYKEKAIYMDWDKPLKTFDGRTGRDMAAVGFNMHYLIQDDYTIDYGKKYDYTCFGLYYSAVGDDVEKNDFFENLD